MMKQRYRTSYFLNQTRALIFMMNTPRFTVTDVWKHAEVQRSTVQAWFAILREEKYIDVVGRMPRERQHGGVLAYIYTWTGPRA